MKYFGAAGNLLPQSSGAVSSVCLHQQVLTEFQAPERANVTSQGQIAVSVLQVPVTFRNQRRLLCVLKRG